MRKPVSMKNKLKGMIGLLTVFALAVIINGNSAYAEENVLEIDANNIHTCYYAVNGEYLKITNGSFGGIENGSGYFNTATVQGDIVGNFTGVTGALKCLKITNVSSVNGFVNFSIELSDIPYTAVFHNTDGNTYTIYNTTGRVKMPDQNTAGFINGIDILTGWSETQGGVGEYLCEGYYNFASEGTKDFYAYWQTPKYVIYYYPDNTESGTPVLQTSIGNPVFTLLSQEETGFSNGDRTFQGWADENGNDVIDTYTFSEEGDAKLHAKWSSYSYKIYYDWNDGTSPDSEYSITGSTTLKTGKTRTGYVFKGWATTSTATAAEYAGGATFTYESSYNNETVHLYAVWEKDPVYTFYVSQGGFSDGGQNVIMEVYVKNGDVIAADGPVVVSGDWNANIAVGSNATVRTGNASQKVMLTATDSGSITSRYFYPYKINYYLNDGTSTVFSTTSSAINVRTTIGTANDPTRSGYDFMGWSTTQNGAVIDSNDLEYYPAAANEILSYYAVWRHEMLEVGTSINRAGTFTLSRGNYAFEAGSFSIGDGYTYSGGSFYVPTGGSYTFVIE